MSNRKAWFFGSRDWPITVNPYTRHFCEQDPTFNDFLSRMRCVKKLILQFYRLIAKDAAEKPNAQQTGIESRCNQLLES